MKPILILFASALTLDLAFSQGSVTTYAGTGIAGLKNGQADTSQLKKSFGICKDNLGNLFIADNGNNCIRKITPAGIVSTYAGSATAGYKDGRSDTALFNAPSGVCADDSGNIYVADFVNQRIRKISTTGWVSTIAGSGIAGLQDGAGDSARFNYPRGICIDKNYNIYVGDSWNHRIRKITPNGNVSTYAGGGIIGVQSVGGYVDAADTAARFYTPCGLSVDTAGNVFVADAYTHRIRKIDTSGMVSTVIGSGPIGQGQGAFHDSTALDSRLNVPTEVFVDSAGNLYIGDTFNHRIRKMDKSTGNVSTVAGNGIAGFINGAPGNAEFNNPRGIVAYSDGRVYVVDFNNNCIRLISPFSSGINDLNPDNSISIFPNPFSFETTIQTTKSFKNASIAIYNSNGHIVMVVENVSGSTISLNRDNLSSGIYYILFQQGNHSLETEKLIITNR